MRTSLALVALTAAAFTPVTHAQEGPGRVPTLCYEVWRTGTVGPPVHVGPFCVPILMPPENCQTTVITTTPLNVVTIYWCVPR